jgi:hypothetical protein
MNRKADAMTDYAPFAVRYERLCSIDHACQSLKTLPSPKFPNYLGRIAMLSVDSLVHPAHVICADPAR